MPSWKKIIVSGSAGSLSALTVSTNITASGHVSASSTSTGSFGAVNVVGMSVSNLVDVSSSFSTRVSNLKTDSGSFSTRVAAVEAFDIDDDLTFAGDSGGNLSINLDSETLTIAGGTNATTVGSGNGVTVNVDDSFLVNNASDTTSGTITAAGLITSGNVSGSLISTGSFGRLEATIGPFFELDSNNDIMPL